MFKTIQVDGKARLGEYETSHGSFQTPNFMPVGTKASVKGVLSDQLESMGAQIVLVNTFHLWQRPGEDLIEQCGGIHSFMGWSGPILSDSGGFQVFSLEKLREIKEEGVAFRSPIDGRKLLLSPEKAINIQEKLGVDIAMGFDECPPSTLSYDETATSLERTQRWLKRCIEAKTREDMSLFGITQGALYKELRTASIQEIAQLPFDGYAIGGLSVGEGRDDMYEVLSYHPEQLPPEKVRYLMGVGTPEDLVQAVWSGVDLFDCVMPTRSGRFGRVFISGEEPVLNLKNAKFKDDTKSVDENCSCICCSRYSRAYIHHLFKAQEMLAPQLLSLHNLSYYMNLMSNMRMHISNGSLSTFHQAERQRWNSYRVTKEAQ